MQVSLQVWGWTYKTASPVAHLMGAGWIPVGKAETHRRKGDYSIYAEGYQTIQAPSGLTKHQIDLLVEVASENTWSTGPSVKITTRIVEMQHAMLTGQVCEEIDVDCPVRICYPPPKRCYTDFENYRHWKISSQPMTWLEIRTEGIICDSSTDGLATTINQGWQETTKRMQWQANAFNGCCSSHPVSS